MTVSRRSLLEWLGTGATLALGGPALASLLSSCGTDDKTEGPAAVDAGAPPSADASSMPDTGGDTAAPPVDRRPFPQGFPFTPNEPEGHPVFDGWGERTVDIQDLAATLASWKLVVDGMVERPLSLSFADLVDLRRTDMIADFHCVEGWSIYDVPYNGVRLSQLLELARPTREATHLTFHSVPSRFVTYLESIPIEVAREDKTLLAYGIAGATIPLKHGFPARLVIPRLLAYKSAKFVQRIELDNRPRDGFWVARGYGYDAEVPAERLREGKY